jgi:hypothetical protein
MNARQLAHEKLTQVDAQLLNGGPDQSNDMARLLKVRPTKRLSTAALPTVIVGELLGIADDGKFPLVIYPGQHGTAALRARTVLDLHSEHVGQSVLLQFEGGDPTLPIVTGVLRHADDEPQKSLSNVYVDLDGQRTIISAQEQLVLQCGKASITLTKAGKVLVRGTYVASHSDGVNRLSGGSIQLN